MEYARHDIQIALDLEKYKKEITRFYGNLEYLPDFNFDARIIYSTQKPEHITLTILYEEKYHLNQLFEHLTSHKINILELIKTSDKKYKWQNPDYFDLSGTNLIGMEWDPSHEYNKRPVHLTLDNLNVLFSGRPVEFANFELTENGLNHLLSYINYGRLNNDRTTYRNAEVLYTLPLDDFTFGEVTFEFSVEHDYSHGRNYKFNITRKAHMVIKKAPDEMSSEEMIRHANLILLLISFYAEKDVGFFRATLKENGIPNYETREVFRYSNELIDNDNRPTLTDRFSTVTDLLISVNYSGCIKCECLLQEIIPRINRVKHLDEHSCFMAYYNVIEKIRNYCKPDSAILRNGEEFRFTVGKKKVDKLITQKIKELLDIIHEDDSQDFANITNEKVPFIKKKKLIIQFKSLLEHFDLDADNYQIDLEILINTRNKIYHGDQPKTDLKQLNAGMKMLIFDLILKLIQKSSRIPTVA